MLRRPIQLLRFVKDVAQEFIQDRGALFAAAMSYYGLISLIPLMLLGIAVFGYVMGSYVEARQQVARFVAAIIPVGGAVVDQNLEVLSRQSGWLGGLGILGLLWIGSQVFVTLQDVMNMAMGAQHRVGFLRARLTALVTMMVAGVLLALSISVTYGLAAVRSLNLVEKYAGGLTFFWDFLGLLLPFILSVMGFIITYRFLPTKRIGNKAPVLGGVVAGMLFELAKHGFAWYVAHVANASRFYGLLGGVVGIMVWIHLVSTITILGAEIASVYFRWSLGSAKG